MMEYVVNLIWDKPVYGQPQATTSRGLLQK